MQVSTPIAKVPRPSSVPEAFSRQALHHPGRPALRWEGEDLTYAELEQKAHRLAQNLAEAGVGSGDRVVLLLPRCPGLIVAMLATLRCRAAYVPLDPDLPSQRLDFILRDLEPKCLLALESGPRLSAPDFTVLPVSPLGLSPTSLPSAPQPLPPQTPQPDDPAYIMYTSGSTGAPKGCVIPHRGILRLVLDTDYVCLDPDTVTLHLAAPSFDASTFEVWGPLLNGGCVCLYPDPVPTLQGIRREIARGQVNTCWLTAGLFHLVVDEAPDLLQPLRQLLAGGDVLSRRHVLAVRHALPHLRLINGYGPTENTTFSCCCDLGAFSLDHFPERVPIGRPIARSEVLILREDLTPAEPGEEGELFLGGEGLALGYWRRPELDREKFLLLSSPAGAPPRRFYRSGDRGLLLPGGIIDFLGRRDRQVKIRGFRVELDEIEKSLLSLPGIVQAAVEARPGSSPSADREIVAWFKPAPGGPSSPQEVLQNLRDRLPAFLLPQSCFALDSFPLTPNGKIDRARLPSAPGPSLRPGNPPRPGLEADLAKLWQEVLGGPLPRREDSFFQLGGDSLKAILLAHRIGKRWGTTPPLRELFENSRLQDGAGFLAAFLADSRNSSPAGTQAPAVTPLSRPPAGPWRVPAGSPQRRMWFVQELNPDSTAYNIVDCWHFHPPPDWDHLESAVRAVIARHEILRTRFQRDVEGFLQVVSPSLSWNLDRFPALPTFSHALEANPPPALAAYIQHPFSPEDPGLLRMGVFPCPDGSAFLVVIIHHALTDGWGIHHFYRQVAAAYRSLALGTELPSDPPLLHYADHCAALDQLRQGPRGQSSLAFWQERIAHLGPPTVLLPDLIHPPLPAGREGALLVRTLPHPLRTGLAAQARHLGVSDFLLCLTLFSLTLRDHAGSSDLVFGYPVTGRALPGSEEEIGPFLNLLPLALTVPFAGSFRDLLDRVRAAVWEALDHEIFPFEEMGRLRPTPATTEPPPLFRILFAYQNFPQPELTLGSSTGRRQPLHNGSVKFDLTFALYPEAESLRLECEYDRALFLPARMERFVAHFLRLADAIAANLPADLSTISGLPPGERGHLLHWSQPRSPNPHEASVPALFLEQAALYPGKAALIQDDRSLTYAELDLLSRRIAVWLAAQGLGPGSRVGLIFGRSLHWVAAMLGVLRAGAAYVPLDPSDPSERLLHQLEDAETGCVILATPFLPADLTPFHPVTLEHILAASPAEAAAGSPLPSPFPAAADPAYLMYTSGSTGGPKGCLIPHRAIARLVRGTHYASFGPEEVFLSLSSPAFDAATFEVWGALLNGSTLVLLAPSQPSLAEIGAAIRAHHVTTCWLTAGLFHLVVDEAPAILEPLRQVLAGGDALSADHIRRLRRLFPSLRLINGYGPTENTTFSCCCDLNAWEFLPDPVPIGRPIPNSEAFILDPALGLAPIGAPGELLLGGDGLSLGYWRRPDLNREKFLPHPFSNDPTARLYRSGDRARYLENGEIQFLGRLDRQVKVRGFRVEPAEIEARLRAVPGLRQSLVWPSPAARSGSSCLAAVVTGPADPAFLPAVRRHLQDTLPAYMLPTLLRQVDAIPLTRNGKVDYAVLDAGWPEVHPPAATASTPHDTREGPATVTEARLQALWGSLFPRRPIGLDDNFFALGGDSLLSVRYLARMEKEFGVALPLNELFHHPTIRSMARRLQQQSPALDYRSLIPLNSGAGKSPLYIVHGYGGEIFIFLDLVRRLPPALPVFGLQTWEFSGSRVALASIEEASRHYVAELIRFQPEGPFSLLGYSMGGLLAWEIARQLLALGRTVDFLAIIDTIPPNLPPHLHYPSVFSHLFFRAWQHLGSFLQTPPGQWSAFLRDRRQSAKLLLQSVLRRHRRKAQQPQAPSPKTGGDDRHSLYLRLYRQYVPRPSPLHVHLFLASDHRYHLPRMWRYLARAGLTLHPMEGRHSDFFNPAKLDRFAAELTASLPS